jgi:hypothetical protein
MKWNLFFIILWIIVVIVDNNIYWRLLASFFLGVEFQNIWNNFFKKE